MAEYVTVGVHREFVERIDAENKRQNHRIEKLEDSVEKIAELTSSVKVLAVNIDTMSKEIVKQGDKIDKLEGKPAQNWEKLVWAIGAAVITAIVALVLKQIGI